MSGKSVSGRVLYEFIVAMIGINGVPLSGHRTVIINMTLVARVTLTHYITALVMGPIEMLYKSSLYAEQTPSRDGIAIIRLSAASQPSTLVFLRFHLCNVTIFVGKRFSPKSTADGAS